MTRQITLTLLLCACCAVSFRPALADAPQPLVMVLGDSISAAYGMPTEYGWVALLDEALQERNIPARMVNASISGETTTGALARLPALLQEYPVDTLIIELGGNNALRGQPLDIMREELRQLINQAQNHGASVLLIGMHIPPNYGKRYAQRFHQTFVDLAAQEQTALVPFLLEDFATEDGMIQADGIHPSAAAQPLMVNNVLPHLLPLLDTAASAHGETLATDIAPNDNSQTSGVTTP